jgi:hypothetical protein
MPAGPLVQPLAPVIMPAVMTPSQARLAQAIAASSSVPANALTDRSGNPMTGRDGTYLTGRV